MKISNGKNETILRLGPGESALYYFEDEGTPAIGCLTTSTGPDITTIDAALRGFAAMITHDPEALKVMADFYHNVVAVSEGCDESVRH